MKLALAFVVALTGFCQAAAPSAQQQEMRPVEAQLLADVASVRPGQTFTAGVLLKMRPEWHVYWKNPGDSGIPVQIELTGPEGTKVGEMRWPVPVDFMQPGEIIGYGYTDAVLFPIEVTAPATAAPGASLALGAKVSWLACKDVCIPGRATLDLAVPVAAEGGPANAPLFAEWRAKLPGDTRAVTKSVDESPLAANARTGTVRVAIDWKTPPKRVEFFPGADPALTVSNVRVADEGGRTVLSFDAEIFEGQSPSSDHLESLVVYTDAGGARRGVWLPVRLRAEDRTQKGA